MDIVMGIALGSATQVALFVLPACVLLGWAMDKPMSAAASSSSVDPFYASPVSGVCTAHRFFRFKTTGNTAAGAGFEWWERLLFTRLEFYGTRSARPK